MNAAVAALAAVLATAVGLARLRPSTGRLPVPRPPRWPRAAASWRSWRRSPSGPTDLEVAAWCQRVARSSRAGSSLTQAIGEADAETPADRRPFPEVSHAVGRGRALADALDRGHADPSTPTGVAGPVLRACADVGGPPAPPLERVADVLTARAADADERVAATAQARLSTRVLTAVPIGVALFLAVSEPAIRGVLTTPAGLACLVAGVILNALGRWWTAVLIRSAS